MEKKVVHQSPLGGGKMVLRTEEDVVAETRASMMVDLQALSQKIDKANALEQTIAKWTGVKELLEMLKKKTDEDCALCPVFSSLINPELPRNPSCKSCPATLYTNLHADLWHREGETLCSLGMAIRMRIFDLHSCVSSAIEELRKNADSIERDEEEEANEEIMPTTGRIIIGNSNIKSI